MSFIEQISRYIFLFSLVLNAILLMYLAGILPFLLYVSVLINMFLVWYSYQFINENKNIEEDLNILFENTEEFIDHVEQLHELEMYYGDQNLQSLIEHSKDLANGYIDIQEKYYDVEVEIEDDEEKEEE
jgi:hypothetical protein